MWNIVDIVWHDQSGALHHYLWTLLQMMSLSLSTVLQEATSPFTVIFPAVIAFSCGKKINSKLEPKIDQQ